MISQTKIIVATQIQQPAVTKSYPGSSAMIKRSKLTKKMTPPNGLQASFYEYLCC
jgi:hypothetical protein